MSIYIAEQQQTQLLLSFLLDHLFQLFLDRSKHCQALTMQFSISLLAIVGSFLLIYCPGLAMEQNRLVPRRPPCKNPPRQGFERLKLTKESVHSREHLREERVVSLHLLLSELELQLNNLRRTLSTRERKHYIDAVLCIQSVKPALYENDLRGASSRYIDFQVVHINQTSIIHVNVYFSTAHRANPLS